MTESSRNLLVGVFVVTSLGALAVMMVWFGETPTWLPTSEWTLRITGVSDLRGVGDGTPVNLNGVAIGRVTTLDFLDREHPEQGVVIITRIKNIYSIPRGARAKVYGATLGIGGGQITLVLDPGADATPLARDDAQLRGEMASMIGELITKDLVDSVERAIDNIGSVAGKAVPVAENLAKMIEQRSISDIQKGRPPNVVTVIERMDNLLANLNTVLGDEALQGDVAGVVRDLKDVSTTLKETVLVWKVESQKLADNANAGIDRTEEHLDQAFAALGETLERMTATARSLSDVMQSIAEGHGSVGLLVRDERLYESAVLALERLTTSLNTINRVVGKMEEDGYISIGKITPVGVFPVKIPLPALATEME